MEDWLKKELSGFELEPQKESWKKIAFHAEPMISKKHTTPRYVLTTFCVCVALACINIFPTATLCPNSGIQKRGSKNLASNQRPTNANASHKAKELKKKHQDQTKDSQKKKPTQALEQAKVGLLKTNKLQNEHNLFRKNDVGGLAYNPLLMILEKQSQMKKPTKLKKVKQKLYTQINYKLTIQNRPESTKIISHKLEGLIFRDFRGRFSVGFGLGVEKSKWKTIVGKKLNKKWFNQNNTAVTSEVRDYFVVRDTIFIKNKTHLLPQEDLEKINYWKNSFYAKNGASSNIKENKLWLLSVPVKLRFDILRKNGLVIRVTVTINPQIIFNQNSVASHDELNVWAEDNRAFKKTNMVYEGSIGFEKKTNKNQYNIQFSAGINPLEKQTVYKKEKLENSIFGSIGLGYLFGR